MSLKKLMFGDPASYYIKVGAVLENERIVQILENHRISIIDISSNNWIGLWHDAIAEVKADAEISQVKINENDFYYSEGIESGAKAEQERNVALAKSLICFDNLEGRGCDHSVCFMLTELIEKIQA